MAVLMITQRRIQMNKNDVLVYEETSELLHGELTEGVLPLAYVPREEPTALRREREHRSYYLT
eukprot:4826120-Amphidinium_carterae.1